MEYFYLLNLINFRLFPASLKEFKIPDTVDTHVHSASCGHNQPPFAKKQNLI